MCGIYGSVGVTKWRPEVAANVLRRRGPDDSGVWTDSRHNIILGHVRLSIIDTSSAGHQPMQTQCGNIVMVFNGEIYNYRELRQELTQTGVSFRSHSDSEVLLALYAEHGVRAFGRLNGIFSAAFWERDKERLTIVRDPLGVKPLYYVQEANGFVFASEMKALLRSGAAEPTLNPAAVYRHLAYLWSPGKETIVQGIEKLLPGYWMRVLNGSIEEAESYRDIIFPEKMANTGTDDARRTVTEAVRRSVRRQMVSDVPLGAFLSGGLDSSAVAAFAQEKLKEDAGGASRQLQCFTIAHRGGSTSSEGFSDDLPYARQVAAHLGADLHVVEVGPEMAGRLSEMIYFLDEPTADFAALNTLFISQLARAHGIKVLLSGAGGDDIFTGYRRHYALQQEKWWAYLPQPIRAGMSAVTRTLPRRFAITRRIAKAFEYAGSPADQRLMGYFLWSSPSGALSLLSPEFRAQLSVDVLYSPLQQTLSRLPSHTESINKMLYLECKHFLADHNLNYTDKMAMAAGVEVRVPLLDLELVKLAGELPANLKQRGSVGKWIFKKAMEPYLPRNVIYRKKTGFGVPFRGWMRGPLKSVVDDALSTASVERRGVFDAVAVKALRQQDVDGRIDASYTLLSLVCLELWCRQFIDGNYSVDACI